MKTKKNFIKRFVAKTAAAGSVASTALTLAGTQALAEFGDTVTVTSSGDAPDAGELMGKIIGILLTITRYVGIALVIYGVYEIVMSFMQNQPEAKTKGIVMALAGVVMVGLKTIISSLGIVS
jgi:hypothetical protein